MIRIEMIRQAIFVLIYFLAVKYERKNTRIPTATLSKNLANLLRSMNRVLTILFYNILS